MYGAIIGDIVGSKYERSNIKTKDFMFISDGCRFTDDSVMTVAVAKALMRSRAEKAHFKPILIDEMQKLGREYPYAGYGRAFSAWLGAMFPEPYNSWGNGSAMRASPCGLIAVTLEEAIMLARASAEVTHNHPEGIKGAEATAAAVFMAKTCRSKAEIKEYIEKNYYALDKTLDEIRPGYTFDVSCQGTLPPAIIAFLESESYEDAIRNAVSIGGDSDTIAAITGAIAWSYYRFNGKGPFSDKKPYRIWTQECEDVIERNMINRMLPDDFVKTIDEFDIVRMQRCGTYDRTGFASEILP